MASNSGRLSPADTAMTSQMAQNTEQGRQRHNTTGGSSSVVLSTASSFFCFLALLSVMRLPVVKADCWLIEGEKGFVWLAICSMNQPPYEAIPSHINRYENLQRNLFPQYFPELLDAERSHTSLHSTIVDLRLNENKIRAVHYSSLSRFSNLTYLNLTKNDISYVEDGAFSAQFNLQVRPDTICIHRFFHIGAHSSMHIHTAVENYSIIWVHEMHSSNCLDVFG